MLAPSAAASRTSLSALLCAAAQWHQEAALRRAASGREVRRQGAGGRAAVWVLQRVAGQHCPQMSKAALGQLQSL